MSTEPDRRPWRLWGRTCGVRADALWLWAGALWLWARILLPRIAGAARQTFYRLLEVCWCTLSTRVGLGARIGQSPLPRQPVVSFLADLLHRFDRLRSCRLAAEFRCGEVYRGQSGTSLKAAQLDDFYVERTRPLHGTQQECQERPDWALIAEQQSAVNNLFTEFISRDINLRYDEQTRTETRIA